MTDLRDPLGLTPDQRVMSNVYAIMTGRPVWLPPEIYDRVIDGEWVEGHTEGPVLAETRAGPERGVG